jgi:hypothetical protein
MACCTEPLLRAVRQIHAVDSFEMLVVLPAAAANCHKTHGDEPV